MRDAVRAVARLFPTAIISGRGREKVQDFVKLGELYYAGSHGMDIVGPTVGAGNLHSPNIRISNSQPLACNLTPAGASLSDRHILMDTRHPLH